MGHSGSGVVIDRGGVISMVSATRLELPSPGVPRVGGTPQERASVIWEQLREGVLVWAVFVWFMTRRAVSSEKRQVYYDTSRRSLKCLRPPP